MAGYEDIDLKRRICLARGGHEAEIAALLERYRNYLLVLARLHVSPRAQAKVGQSEGFDY